MPSEYEASHKLSIVGIGPGDRDQMTFQSLKAIEGADFVIGYKPYLELIGSLLKGKRIISSSMGKEVERARLAAELLDEGSVALVSSGDPNVFGMAGLGLELASRSFCLDRVEVVPGVTSFTAAACRAGIIFKEAVAVISLSDLLTPWSGIEERLNLAVEYGMPVALYNPRSRRRDWQLERALEIYGRDTDLLVARNIGRDGEELFWTSSERLLEEGDLQHKIDMFSIIILAGKGMMRCDISRPSSINIVGIGPGSLQHLTVQARRLLQISTKVFGAQRYLQKIKSLLRGEAIAHRGSCAQRMALRLQDAREASKRGCQTSILTGGDPSIFSSAWRILRESKGHHNLHVCSGVSAFSAVAARAGAPLICDFVLLSQADRCCNLSRLAKAGFGVGFYNVSGLKLQSLLQQAPPDRPCVLARDVTRNGESIKVLTASEMLEATPNGHRFTLLMAPPNSYIKERRIIARRGYEIRYSY